jgi:hypothetical protein
VPRCPWCGTRRSGDPCVSCGRSQALDPFDDVVDGTSRRAASADAAERSEGTAMTTASALSPEFASDAELPVVSVADLPPEWLAPAADPAWQVHGRAVPPSVPTRGRQWVLTVALLVAAWSLAVFGGAYAWTTASVLRRVEQAWLAADSMRVSRAEIEVQLATANVEPTLRETVDLALNEEQRLTLDDIVRRLGNQRILDPSVSELRDQMVAALTAESAALGTEDRVESFAQLLLVDEELADQLGRWWLRPGAVETPLRLVSADYMIAGAVTAANGG